MYIIRSWKMCRVADLLICALYIVWLPAEGITQQITAEQFQLLVEERVKNLSLIADSAYVNIIQNVTGNQSCPYGNQLYDTCSVTLQPDDVTFDETFMRDISMSTSSVYFRQFLAGYAAVFSSINDYRLVEGVFDRLCMSEALSNGWISLGDSNVSVDDGLLLHYYGDEETAIIRTYPYFSHDPSSDLCKRRQLDPRFRPWYVSTVTAAKGVYVLLHSNKFDMLPLIREAAIRLLNTLSHQDHFFIWFSDPNIHYSDDFVLTNESMREDIEQFIRSSTERPLSPSLNIATQLKEAFRLFRLLGNQSVCHQIIVILSDSTLDQSIVEAVTMAKQENDGVQQIDIYTMIFGIEADDRFAALLSCSNGGDHFVVTDMAGVDEAVTSYYRVYSAVVAMETNEREVSWSEVYSDFFLETDVLSACLPVRDVAIAELLGVTCVDVNVTYLESLSNGAQVLSSLVNAPSVTCPNTDITADVRSSSRTYRYCDIPANLSTVEQFITLYQDSVEQVVDLLILAQPIVRNIPLIGSPRQLCPFGAIVYDACTDDQLPYSFNSRLGNNVTNITSNVNFSPTTLNQLDGFSLVDYSIDNPLFEPLCYSSIAERQWYRLLTLNPHTTLQYYASDEGFIRLYPAIRYNKCYPPSYDPRTRPFYAAAASGRKDVVMVIDISNSAGIPVAMAVVRDILNTLSAIDYFDVISSSNGSFSNSAGLTAATMTNKVTVNTTYLPNIVAMASNQSSLVAMAFQAATGGRSNNNTANCQIAIIFITDRQVTRDTADAAASINRNIQSIYKNPAKLFVTSLTDDLTGYYDDMAVQLTCNHSGIWNKISSSVYSHNSMLSVISYYRVLASAVMVRQPVWSEVYEDYTGIGDVVTVCQPHYDETINIGQLLGMACADITVEMLQQVEASIDFISALIHRQNLLSCQQFPVPIITLESLRPMDAKCLSAPPTTSLTMSSSVVITNSSTTTVIVTTPTVVTTSVIVTTPTVVTTSVTVTTPTVITTFVIVTSSISPTSNATISGVSSAHQLTAGAIAGIIIACVVVLTIILIVLIGWYHYRNIRLYRVHGGYNYKRHTQGKEFMNNDLSDALVSEVEDDEKDEL